MSTTMVSSHTTRRTIINSTMVPTFCLPCYRITCCLGNLWQGRHRHNWGFLDCSEEPVSRHCCHHTDDRWWYEAHTINGCIQDCCTWNPYRSSRGSCLFTCVPRSSTPTVYMACWQVQSAYLQAKITIIANPPNVSYGPHTCLSYRAWQRKLYSLVKCQQHRAEMYAGLRMLMMEQSEEEFLKHQDTFMSYWQQKEAEFVAYYRQECKGRAGEYLGSAVHSYYSYYGWSLYHRKVGFVLPTFWSSRYRHKHAGGEVKQTHPLTMYIVNPEKFMSNTNVYLTCCY